MDNTIKSGARTKSDLDTVYGNDAKTAAEVRKFEHGLLKISYTPYSNLEQLPKRNGSKCPFAERAERCFKAGDSRAEDNLMLLSVHGLWLREHNRVARKLAYINPKWDDETLYQEARRITIAEYQHITVHEFIPVLIGEKLSRDFELLPLKDGYASDYEKKVQANTINEFAAAAIRIAHTLVVDEYKRADKYHRLYDLRNISDYQFNTVKYAIDAPLEDILYGSLNEATYIKACQMNKEMNNYLFEGVFSNKDTKRWALFTRNMARGRDHGFLGYNHYREKCGLNKARHFEDLRSNIPDFLIERLKQLYRHVDDIDLYAGLISEEHLKGAAAGFTSACIIAKQFSDVKVGDRFWYENGDDKNVRLTIDQLSEIRHANAARLICDNTNLKDVQKFPFLMPNYRFNSYVSCKELPEVSLRPWTDYGSGPSESYDGDHEHYE